MSNNTDQDQHQQQQTHHKYSSKLKVESIEEIKDSDKTQLQREYTIWAIMKSGKLQMDYENVVKALSTFRTVEDFWATYSHFKRPTQMSFGTSIYIFADGIKPMWEDEQCKDGGKWAFKVPKTHTNKYWEDILLNLIGEQFSIENEILGIALSLKPNYDILQVWIRSGKDQDKINTIKEDIQRFVKIDEQIMLEFENFEEVLNRPKPEKKEVFSRNIPQDSNDQSKDNQFERKQINKGGGFSRGRGRGRGQQ